MRTQLTSVTAPTPSWTSWTRRTAARRTRRPPSSSWQDSSLKENTLANQTVSPEPADGGLLHGGVLHHRVLHAARLLSQEDALLRAAGKRQATATCADNLRIVLGSLGAIHSCQLGNVLWEHYCHLKRLCDDERGPALTRNMIYVGEPKWGDIKTLGTFSVSICLYLSQRFTLGEQQYFHGVPPIK